MSAICCEMNVCCPQCTDNRTLVVASVGQPSVSQKGELNDGDKELLRSLLEKFAGQDKGPIGCGLFILSVSIFFPIAIGLEIIPAIWSCISNQDKNAKFQEVKNGNQRVKTTTYCYSICNFVLEHEQEAHRISESVTKKERAVSMQNPIAR